MIRIQAQAPVRYPWRGDFGSLVWGKSREKELQDAPTPPSLLVGSRAAGDEGKSAWECRKPLVISSMSLALPDIDREFARQVAAFIEEYRLALESLARQ